MTLARAVPAKNSSIATVPSVNMSLASFLAELGTWLPDESKIKCALLVGSHARDQATAESDIDFVLLCDMPQDYVDDVSWARRFGAIRSTHIEDWGQLMSARVFYVSGLEVEFGFAHSSWLDLPLDDGTAEVLTGGYRILHDPQRVCAGL